MRRVIIKHPKTILFDAIIDAFGKIYIKKCIDSLYLELIKCVINGEYEIEFIDEVFKIDEKDVFKNLEKFKEEPNYKNKIEIKKVNADDILEYTNQNNTPIDLKAICNFFNISLEKKDLPYDGLSKYENNQYYIFYKSGDFSPLRERFTIAHELGHIFLHFSTNKKIFTDEILNNTFNQKNIKIAARGLNSISNIELEREANNFAAELLMPSNLIKNYISNYFSINELADIFKISYTSMEIRLKTLGYIPNF